MLRTQNGSARAGLLQTSYLIAIVGLNGLIDRGLLICRKNRFTSALLDIALYRHLILLDHNAERSALANQLIGPPTDDEGLYLMYATVL